ncbi:hypothetical protein ACFSC4_13420 [Deinococcus malanensis]|uniref:ATP-binding protein n=1 Tax=Deinococcus malanensis TaxID=1706855 RepID=UPI003638618D
MRAAGPRAAAGQGGGDASRSPPTGRRAGLPLMARPSYVLGGRAMRTVRSMEELVTYLDEVYTAVEGQPSILLDQFLEGALELDVDTLCDGERAVVAGIMEHVEAAGVHSGDSACVLPRST